jgi:hypothetical protein
MVFSLGSSRRASGRDVDTACEADYTRVQILTDIGLLPTRPRFKTLREPLRGPRRCPQKSRQKVWI